MSDLWYHIQFILSILTILEVNYLLVSILFITKFYVCLLSICKLNNWKDISFQLFFSVSYISLAIQFISNDSIARKGRWGQTFFRNHSIFSSTLRFNVPLQKHASYLTVQTRILFREQLSCCQAV